jgi:pimeloyl-ACP methyl ester carboxylesterase
VVTGPRPVVAVPGLGLSAEIPQRLFRALATAGPTAAVELPGFGLPAPRGLAIGMAAQVDRLLDVLRGRGPGDPVVLLGHSASCQLVAEVAAREPERVAGLVLVGPTTDPRGWTWPGLAARWVRTAAHERPGQIPRLLRDYRTTGPVAMMRTLDAFRRCRIEDSLGSVRCPVLVLRGLHDRIAPADWTAALARLPPDGSAVTVAAGGHMVLSTHPGLVAAEVSAFLARRVGVSEGR